MQLTTLVLPLALALFTAANPLSDRQSARVKATFYKDGGCQNSTGAPSQYFDQLELHVCRNATIPVAHESIKFEDRSLGRTSK
jgi:hypothetical protein